MAKPQDFVEVAKYIETGKCETEKDALIVGETIHREVAKKIRSSASARQQFYYEQGKKYKKEKKAW